MLWKTHIRITNEVFRRLGITISPEVSARLRDGLILPDKWGNFPHHYGKRGDTCNHILKARKCILTEKLPDAYFNLGVALHYVQDSYTSLSSDSMYHTEWEQRIEQAYLADNLGELVERAFQNKEYLKGEYLWVLKHLSSEIEGQSDTLDVASLGERLPRVSRWRFHGAPYIDFNFAFRASLSIVKSVVLGARTSSRLQSELNVLLARHETRLKDAEKALTQRIVQLVRKRDEWEKSINSPRRFSTLRKVVQTVMVRIRNFQAESKLKEYEEQKHLKRVITRYYDVARATCAPYSSWFSIEIPKIEATLIEKELLPITEACEAFGTPENAIRYLVETGKTHCYHVRKKDLVQRSELRESLRKDFL